MRRFFWPELTGLRAVGISDYCIFLDEETLTLFTMQKLNEGNFAAALTDKLKPLKKVLHLN
jgi:L-rhamnose mutarotase